ncbi:hypothetical protein ACTXT7_010753 [Hymenolepis weldensis]
MTESLNLNCKQPSKTISSATEFDTKLFQTDIRELSQELPEHADGYNPLQDDIHDFLPEHATTSRKTRDKRKRKTPKSTAVNQQKPEREQTTRINPTKTIPINMPTSSQPASPSTKLQTINYKLQYSVLPKATLMRKHNTHNILASSSKDTVQPSTPSVQSSFQDTVKSTTPPSSMSRSELSRIRCGRRVTFPSRLAEYRSSNALGGSTVEFTTLTRLIESRALEQAGKCASDNGTHKEVSNKPSPLNIFLVLTILGYA